VPGRHGTRNYPVTVTAADGTRAALECVDHVLVFDHDEPSPILRRLQPEVHCKGADYAPPHGKPIPERPVVEAYGGLLVFLPLVDGLSSSDLLRRIQAAAQP
jgi:bifunctional ADP-heptose synthase (sugar kinase/adenylyltransferase)